MPGRFPDRSQGWSAIDLGRASALICRPRIDTVTNSTTSTSATATTITITARAKLDRVIEKITQHEHRPLALAA